MKQPRSSEWVDIEWILFCQLAYFVHFFVVLHAPTVFSLCLFLSLSQFFRPQVIRLTWTLQLDHVTPQTNPFTHTSQHPLQRKAPLTFSPTSQGERLVWWREVFFWRIDVVIMHVKTWNRICGGENDCTKTKGLCGDSAFYYALRSSSS